AWQHFEPDADTLKQKLAKSGKIASADIDGTGQFLKQLEENINGKIKTWAVKWHFSIQLADGLCLRPGRSLVRNIGLDGTGDNSGVTKNYDVEPSEKVEVRPVPVVD